MFKIENFGNKIIGWILLFIGVALIAWGIQGSFRIFLNQRSPPELFTLEEVIIEEDAVNEVTPLDIEGIGRDVAAGMFPPVDRVRIFNLMAWVLFMGILFMGSSRLATIGIQLIAIKHVKK